MLYRKVVLTATVGTLVMGLVLLILVVMSWRSVQRMEPIDRHLEFESKLQGIYDVLSEDLLAAPAVTADFVAAVQQHVRSLEHLVEGDFGIAPETASQLRAGARLLQQAAASVRNGLLTEAAQMQFSDALRLLRHAVRAESAAQWALYRKLRKDNERQFQAALVLAVLLPFAAIGSMFFFRRRVLAPLDDLSYLMGLLARKDYTLALTERIDPPLRPLFEKYNRMVKRIRGLEEGHVKREDALQREVDSATGALIQQQVALARADRLAAVGEMSARLAHELRNPLSGVLMALTNLAEETPSPEHRERLQLAMEELERVARLLSNLVDDARQVPERPQRLRPAAVIGELFRLLRFQLPERIALSQQVSEDLECVLPEARLRQVLINIILNAAQAIGHASGEIQVTAQREGGEIAICVCDDGPGFPADLLERGIHELGSGRRGRTGLGLAAVHRFVRDQGGRLEVFNRDVGGACVLLFFPQETAYG